MHRIYDPAGVVMAFALPYAALSLVGAAVNWWGLFWTVSGPASNPVSFSPFILLVPPDVDPACSGAEHGRLGQLARPYLRLAPLQQLH